MEIPLFKMSVDEADVKAANSVLRRDTYWAEGKEINDFETGLCQYIGIPGVVVCNSGTSALHLAMIANGIKPFHDVIVPSFTFIATANCVKFVGAKVVFADIEDKTFGLDPVDVEKKVTRNTRAIIAVHYGGMMCRIVELRRIAQKYNLILIEDGAESLGATTNGLNVGKFGDCGILSFCQNKIITTGEGGAFVTENKFLYDKAMLARSHGREGDYLTGDYVSLGYNFRMPSVNAAIGLSQLNRINDLIAQRQQVAKWYDAALPVSVIRPIVPEAHTHVYQLYTVRIPDGKRDAVMHHLKDKLITSKVYFLPVHQTKYYARQHWVIDKLPVTEKIASEVLSLPMYPTMTQKEVEYVCDSVKEALC